MNIHHRLYEKVGMAGISLPTFGLWTMDHWFLSLRYEGIAEESPDNAERRTTDKSGLPGGDAGETESVAENKPPPFAKASGGKGENVR